MPKDAKEKARADVKRAQSKCKQTGAQHEDARKATGLLRCQGAYVQPTRAALYYERLERLG